MSTSSPPIDPNQCFLKLTTERDFDYPTVISHITLKAVHPTHGVLGNLSAVRILRENCRGFFLRVADADTQELHDFAVTLFDKFGLVRPWIVEDGKRKGTGVWGRELNEGALVYVSDVLVEPSERGKGIGSWMLTKLKESEYVKDPDFIACWPSPVDFRDHKQYVMERDGQIHFFRQNSFRRIGRTNFFCFSPNPSHPSRSLSIDNDAKNFEYDFDHATQQAAELDEEDAKKAYPIHWAICSVPGPGVSLIIRSQYVTDPTSIHKRDGAGWFPIYVAAQKVHLHAVRTLLELGVGRAGVGDAENKDGMNALERLELAMLSTREFSEAMLGTWDGYTEEGMKCEWALRRAMRLPVMGCETEGAYVQKRKWGCTCGQCAGGWLSRRMRYQLQFQAGFNYSAIKINLEHPDLFHGKHPLEPEKYSFLCDPGTSYLPVIVRHSMTRTFYKGFEKIYGALNMHLLESQEPLTRNVLLHTVVPGDPDVKAYLLGGGKVEYVLDAVTSGAAGKSCRPVGDGMFEALLRVKVQGRQEGEEGEGEGEGEEEEEDEYFRLPVCANDVEFPLVRQQVGLDPELSWGPYDSDVEDEEGEEEFGEEEDEEDEEEAEIVWGEGDGWE